MNYVGKAGTQAGMKAVMPCALKFRAASSPAEVASRYVGMRSMNPTF